MCGFVAGAAVGVYIWGRSEWARSTSPIPGILIIGASGLLAGVGAAIGQEQFWEGAGSTLGAYETAVVVTFVLLVIGIVCYVLFFR